MGNVCAADETQGCLSTFEKQRSQSKKGSKSINGCLIIKIKKASVNMKTLTAVLMEKAGDSSLKDVIMILKFRDQTFELDTVKENFESILKGKTSIAKTVAGKEQLNTETQEDQFKFNCSDITAKDIISIQIMKPAVSEGSDDSQAGYRSPRQSKPDNIMLAQCNLQILWLLKNKDLSLWVKMWAENHDEQLKGSSAKIESIGQLKIKTCFMKNKTFASNEISNIHSSKDKLKEGENLRSEFGEDYYQRRSSQNFKTDYQHSRCTSNAGDDLYNSVLSRSALRQVDCMKQSLCISENESQMDDYEDSSQQYIDIDSPQRKDSVKSAAQKGNGGGPTTPRGGSQQKIQFFNLQNKLKTNLLLQDRDTACSKKSSLDDDNELFNQRSRSHDKNIKRKPKRQGSMIDHFNLKDSLTSGQKIEPKNDDKSLKSDDFQEMSDNNSNGEFQAKSIDSNDSDSLKYIKLQGSKMEQILKQKSLGNSQITRIIESKKNTQTKLNAMDGILEQDLDQIEVEIHSPVKAIET